MKAPGLKAAGMTADGMTAKDGIAGVIADLVRTQAGLDLPVRLRAWDGSEAGPADGPVLVARSPQALRRILWHPGELGRGHRRDPCPPSRAATSASGRTTSAT